MNVWRANCCGLFPRCRSPELAMNMHQRPAESVCFNQRKRRRSMPSGSWAYAMDTMNAKLSNAAM